jgi:hybrid cluster-associated redox disulfide protein
MTNVTKEMIIGDILDAAPETSKYFLEIGMHCLGCPAARSETLEEACQVHGQDADTLLAKINAHLAGQG